MVNSTQEPNRLINESSPYLLQHAYNPVSWYPWGPEAFEKARNEEKPVFLSIGYSTCHWCHVMAHESFEDPEVAEKLNREYIAVKVDKEERPDIDAVYMAVCQGLTGSGGWPMTIIMTPDQKPFFAGTYFPKQRHHNVPGILEILDAITKEWNVRRESLINAGEKIISALNSRPQKRSGSSQTEAQNSRSAGGKTAWAPDQALITEARDALYRSFDEQYGGFGASPKFPMPHNLMFLLRSNKFDREEQALKIVEKTLQKMYRGGIFDHIGYGFSRYSTDNKWLAPHFEKMLYDNALLVIAYLEACQVTGKELYRSVAERTLEYIEREMTDETGGFYSAQDADSDGGEGGYYVLSRKEVVDLLGNTDGTEFCEYFDITEAGNFEGGNIPNLIKNQYFEQIPERIRRQLPRLYEHRLQRTKLHKDDKILTSWNSLMIVAYAKAYKALDKEKYLQIAEKATAFLWDTMTGPEGTLRVSSRGGQATGTGTLDDYAFFIWSLLELYEATLDINYLDHARRICDRMISGFLDPVGGGFYLTDADAEQLIYRPKETYDGAIPSGNSVAGYVLVKLSKLTGMDEYHQEALRQLQFLSEHAGAYPAGHCFAMMALMMEFHQKGFLCENGVCS
jgi:uncharacterized protein YyaL (SSP411 family)